jgi:signal transduction histidine kinase
MPNAAAAGYATASGTETRRAHQLWARYLVAGAGLVILNLLLGPSGLLPVGIPDMVIYGVVGLSGVAAVVLGLRLYRPEHATAWRLLAAGLLAYFVADLVGELLDRRAGGIQQYGSLVDAIYLVRYPLLVAGLLLMVRRRTGRRQPIGLIDTAIVATSLAVVYWVFLIGPAIGNQHVTLAERLTWIAYPSVDMLLLAIGFRLLIGPGARQPAFYLLVGALATVLVSDTVCSLVRILHDGTPPAEGVDRMLAVGWLASYLLIGAAALHPSMRSVTEPSGPGRLDVRTRRRRLALLAILSLVAPGVLAVQDLRGAAVDVLAIAIAWLVLFSLLMVRMAGLLSELDTDDATLRAQRAELEAANGILERVQADRRMLLDRTMRSAEEERTRIAAELHDGPIQRLTALGYGLDEARIAVEFGDVRHGLDILGGAHQVLSGEIDELRRLMTALRPPVLDERGLVLALRDLLDSFQRHTGIATDLMGASEVLLDPDVETVLYRVVQEALTNVAKHAGASRVIVYLRADEGQVETRISDDGIGFDAASTGELTSRGHYGLAGMRERVELAGGSYRLISAPGYGTVVLARVPSQRVPA